LSAVGADIKRGSAGGVKSSGSDPVRGHNGPGRKPRTSCPGAPAPGSIGGATVTAVRGNHNGCPVGIDGDRLHLIAGRIARRGRTPWRPGEAVVGGISHVGSCGAAIAYAHKIIGIAFGKVESVAVAENRVAVHAAGRRACEAGIARAGYVSDGAQKSVSRVEIHRRRHPEGNGFFQTRIIKSPGDRSGGGGRGDTRVDGDGVIADKKPFSGTMESPGGVKGVQGHSIHPIGGATPDGAAAEVKPLGSIDVIDGIGRAAVARVGERDNRPGCAAIQGLKDSVGVIRIQSGNDRVVGVLGVHAHITRVAGPVGRRRHVGPCAGRYFIFPNLSRQGNAPDVVGAVVIAKGHP